MEEMNLEEFEMGSDELEIPDEELPKVQTVADIVGYLEKK